MSSTDGSLSMEVNEYCRAYYIQNPQNKSN